MEPEPTSSDPQLCVLYAPGPPGAACTPLFGLTSVERTALAFARAGVRRFALAGDPASTEALARAFRGGPCQRLRLRVVEAIAPAVGDRPFYLAHADCHYDRQLVMRFVEETRGAGDSVVAVDFRPGAERRGAALPRASVWSDEPRARVQRVANGLVGADGVLVGLVHGTPAIARALDAARSGAPADEDRGDPAPRGRDGRRAWLGALAAVLQREPIESWRVAERWQAVHAEADLAPARREVLAGAARVGDGLVARHLNRPISLRITERLLGRGVAPWQVSIATFALTLAAGLAFAIGHATTGGLIAQTASVLDGVDGELARLRYQDSAFGGLYDALLDRVGEAALLGGMTLYAWLMGAGASAVALGFAALAGNSLSMLVKEKYGTQFRRPWASEREGRWNWLLLGRDGRLFLTLVAGVTGQVELVLAYLAVGTHVHAGARLVRVRAEAARA